MSPCYYLELHASMLIVQGKERLMGLHCDQLLQGIMGFVVQGVRICICALYSLFMPQSLVQTDAVGLRNRSARGMPSHSGLSIPVETQTLHNWKMEQKSHGKRKKERNSF